MPAVTRIGDADVAHCSGMVRAEGSSTVFVNGIGVSRQGDVFVFDKGEIADPVFLEDCTLVVVKIPSIPSDKFEVEQ